MRRTANASGRSRLTVRVAAARRPSVAGVFPVAGPVRLRRRGRPLRRQRDGHIHQGQDITAAEGTPLVAPVGGVVSWVAFQAGGAGHYVVLRAPTAPTTSSCTSATGSITVAKGAVLAAGQQFAQVGSTGASSGPHLHFEIWPDGWYSSKDSAPIDPLPQLMAWAGTR